MPERFSVRSPMNTALPEERLDPFRETARIPRLAFPDDEDAPSHFLKGRFVLPVAAHVAVQLVKPESATLRRLRDAIPRTSLVPMPETPVYEDHLHACAEYEVGVTGQVSCVKSVAIPQAVDQPPDPEFGLRVLRPDTAHPLASLASC